VEVRSAFFLDWAVYSRQVIGVGCQMERLGVLLFGQFQERAIDYTVEAQAMFVMAVFVLVQYGIETAPLIGLEREQRYATMRDCEIDGLSYGRETEQRYRDYLEQRGQTFRGLVINCHIAESPARFLAS
jgi:hypothetical protein